MNLESVRVYCLSLPHATEDVQWGNQLVFRVGKKMFAIAPLEGPAKFCLSFRASAESLAELLENEAVQPAPYLARYRWVAMERFDAVSPVELRELLRISYELVLAGLPRNAREGLR